MLLTDTDSFYYIIELKMFLKIFTKTANYLTSVIIQENKNIMIIQMTLLLVKRKMKHVVHP